MFWLHRPVYLGYTRGELSSEEDHGRRMASPPPKQTMKERILETADKLFYLQGIRAIGVDTIAAESQRLINETYPGFVQGFMPPLARPDVDKLEHLTAAIVVG